MPITMNTILILNLPYVIDKNLNQVYALEHFKFLFITKIKKISDLSLPSNMRQHAIKNPWLRLLHIILYMITNRKKIHHVEIYPGGKLSLALVVLSKTFQLPCVVAERGDIAFLNYGDKLTQFLIEKSYKWADYIWYREYFMKDELNKRGITSLFFQGNVVRMPTETRHHKSIYTFLWCNRLTNYRHSTWFIDILNKAEFHHISSLLIGLLKDNIPKEYRELEEYVINQKPATMTCFPFIPPRKHMIQSRFFVLPGAHIFANFSLLESMSYGVVPIVSNVPGTEKIIQDGFNGLVCEFSKDGLETAMNRALALSESEYQTLSKNARLTIERDFSLTSYAKNMSLFYQSLHP